jgi:hypothetical protein
MTQDGRPRQHAPAASAFPRALPQRRAAAAICRRIDNRMITAPMVYARQDPSRGDATVKDDRLYLHHMLGRWRRITRFIAPGRETNFPPKSKHPGKPKPSGV